MSEKLRKGLMQLGFNTGWVISGDQITLWENSEPIPSIEVILKAADEYVAPEPTIEEKLASVGLSLSDLKSALGLE